MTTRVLSTRALNRALLARQLLLDRVALSIVEAVEQIGGVQNQYAPSGYVALWTRLRDFRRDALTEALERREVVQATLMRTTIHLVSAREFWLYAAGVREARRGWSRRTPIPGLDEATLIDAADRMRAALADGPRSAKELGDLGSGFLGRLALWVDLVRVPPSGTWARRRADRLALVTDWLGPDDATEADGVRHLVRAYLRAFGPAPWRDIGSWSGVPVGDLRRAGADLALTEYRDEAGGHLVDLVGAPLPDPDEPAPVRFLPHWDASLLVHARRAGVLPEVHRPRVFTSKNPFSVGTYLVDGRVAGAWSVRDGRVVLDPYEELAAASRRAVEREREALEAFHR